jgi:hypothetical protein
MPNTNSILVWLACLTLVLGGCANLGQQTGSKPDRPTVWYSGGEGAGGGGGGGNGSM